MMDRIPLAAWISWKLNVINKEQYGWHQRRLFRFVRYGNVAHKLRFQNESVDFIYSSHLLEHIYPNDCINFLKECRRILKPGGTMRHCFPDWDSARKSVSFDQLGFPKTKKDRIAHHWLWTTSEIQNLLQEMGFHDVARCKFQEGDFPDVTLIEKKNGSVIQAVK